jgi:glycosyltransferase involved in cell wall biosynthesis
LSKNLSNPGLEVIIFVGHGASRTGAPNSLLNILKWTRAHTPYELVLILGNGGPLVSEYEEVATVHLWNDRGPGPIRSNALERVSRLWHGKSSLQLRQDKILKDIETRHVRCIFNNTGVNGPILSALRTKIRAPIVSRIPELEGYMRKNNRNGSIDRVLDLTDHYVAVADAVKRNLVTRHAIPADRVSVVHGTSAAKHVDRGTAALRAKLDLPQEAFLVGGCGTLEYHKGIDLFIQLAHYCVNRLGRTDVHFCWIGGCVSQDSCIDYKFEVEHLSLARHLFFAGEVADPAPVFAEFDAFALTSREDSFPLVMIEAARQGLPVLCFQDSGGAAEFVDADIGAAVPMLDIEALAHAVLALKDSPEQRARLGAAAYQRSLAYTPDRMAAAIHQVIDRVVASAAKA